MKKAASHFREGCDARYLGKPLAECPYTFNTPAYRDWVDGWRSADATLAKQGAQK